MRKDQFIEYIASKIPDNTVFKDHTINIRFEKQVGLSDDGTVIPKVDFNINIDADFVIG